MEKYKIMLQRRDVKVQRRLTSLHHPTTRRHLELFAKIFRIKAKIREKRRGRRRTDVKKREGKETDQDRVPLFDLLFYCLFFIYYNMYGSSQLDVLFIYYELTL